MPLSSDPRKRERQLANLQRGGGRPASLEHRPALRHGAYAQLTRSELGAEVAAMRDALGEDAPILDAADAATLEDWAATRVHLRRAEADLRDHGWKDRATGAPRELADYARRLRRDSFDYAKEFGCTPRARAALVGDVGRGFDLAQELARLDGDGAVADAPRDAFGLTLAAVRRELRRAGGPGGVTFVAVPRAQADELRRGVAAERVSLRDLGDGLAELVLLPPAQPPRLLGWAPPPRRRRRG